MSVCVSVCLCVRVRVGVCVCTCVCLTPQGFHKLTSWCMCVMFVRVCVCVCVYLSGAHADSSAGDALRGAAPPQPGHDGSGRRGGQAGERWWRRRGLL